MRITGFAGYYRKGRIVKSESGEKVNVLFGYKNLGITRQQTEAVFGVETVPQVLRIEVMGTDNPFKRNQVVELEGGAFLVLNSSEMLVSQIGGLMVITAEVQKN